MNLRSIRFHIEEWRRESLPKWYSLKRVILRCHTVTQSCIYSAQRTCTYPTHMSTPGEAVFICHLSGHQLLMGEFQVPVVNSDTGTLPKAR